MSRYIEVEKAMELCDEFYFSDETCSVKALFNSAPSIDIVRCQDCKYWVYNFNGCSRNPCTEPWYAEDGCTYGERREP